jgi:hypothetical protein
MQEKHLFEYAVVRVMPRVEREEFINVGVVLYCPGLRYLNVVFEWNPFRMNALHPSADYEELKKYLLAFEKICRGGKDGGAIGQLPPASRFRWLTAVRSSVVQTSRVHPGFCSDPEVALTRLVDQLVR